MQIKTKNVSCHTADSKPVKQEVNGTVILLPLVFLVLGFKSSRHWHCKKMVEKWFHECWLRLAEAGRGWQRLAEAGRGWLRLAEAEALAEVLGLFLITVYQYIIMAK